MVNVPAAASLVGRGRSLPSRMPFVLDSNLSLSSIIRWFGWRRGGDEKIVPVLYRLVREKVTGLKKLKKILSVRNGRRWCNRVAFGPGLSGVGC